MTALPEPDVTGTVFADETPELTRNYAEALVNVAAKDGQADAVLGDLDELVDDLLVGDRRFAALIGSPSVNPADRDRILTEAFEGRAHPTLLRFLRVLNKHGRLGLLGPIARQAREMWDRRQGRRPVLVRSAHPLPDDQVERLREKVRGMIGAEPILRMEVDPELIGGLVVQVGDDLYDGSIRRQFQRFRQHLVEVKAREFASKGATVTTA